jgi:hypothetical protein
VASHNVVLPSSRSSHQSAILPKFFPVRLHLCFALLFDNAHDDG